MINHIEHIQTRQGAKSGQVFLFERETVRPLFLRTSKSGDAYVAFALP